MKTRKLLLVIVLALIITVGGVYATWNYAEKDVGSIDSTVGFKLSSAVNNTEKGTLALKSNTLKIEIDQADAQYNSKLVVTGAIEITFTPNAATAEEVIDAMQLVWSVRLVNSGVDASTFTYDDGTGSKPLFSTFDSATQTVVASKVENGDGTYTFTLDAAAFSAANVFVMNSFKLESMAKYGEFETLLASMGSISVVFSEQ